MMGSVALELIQTPLGPASTASHFVSNSVFSVRPAADATSERGREMSGVPGTIAIQMSDEVRRVEAASTNRDESAKVTLRPWGPDDANLLWACLGDPAMMTYLGGAESTEQLARRQKRYEQPGSDQYVILDENGARVGHVGFWDDGDDRTIAETGWAATPAHQGRGLAVAAVLALARVASAAGRRELRAFPSIENAPSNAVCRKAGVVSHGVIDGEYPPGHALRMTDWRLSLAETVAEGRLDFSATAFRVRPPGGSRST